MASAHNGTAVRGPVGREVMIVPFVNGRVGAAKGEEEVRGPSDGGGGGGR
ncbi:hypothetical protein GCM10023336_63400 [Streptomyces similanensis]|uniref:Uncharacterized protein n=1 Tax=Streptomyces similanensis TaxID=1274988 RepID=A0ABP9LEZ7_9ACTN